MEDDKNKIEEIALDQALAIADSKHTKLVWLGSEPVEYIRGLLELNEDKMIGMNPHAIMSMDKKDAEGLSGSVFVCYHGNTSRTAAKFLKSKYGIESYSLKGGVTAIVGEIF